ARRTASAEGLQRYRAEPYVVAADVYSQEPHTGRGGWTWYTGSAAWMYRAGLESILGLRRHGDTFAISPCIPGTWNGFTIHWRHGRTRYEITVENPGQRSHGVAEALLDGTRVAASAIPLVDDGELHRVRVVMGAAVSIESALEAPGAQR
ncbi:MAG: glycosyltransferase 36 associated protein, partial [Candidatus Eisenbacteria bacterium]